MGENGHFGVIIFPRNGRFERQIQGKGTRRRHQNKFAVFKWAITGAHKLALMNIIGRLQSTRCTPHLYGYCVQEISN